MICQFLKQSVPNNNLQLVIYSAFVENGYLSIQSVKRTWFQQTLNFMNCELFITKLSGIDPYEKKNIGGHDWRKFCMICSKLVASL